jgi:hypothetical protein
MRNAALVLGLIGGIWAMIVGFFVYGYVEFVDWFGEVPDFARQVEDPALFRTVSILSPLLAIAGAAMARARALWGGILMLLAAGGIYHAFGFGVFTMFPIAFCGLAGVLALAAGNPTRKRRISRHSSKRKKLSPEKVDLRNNECHPVSSRRQRPVRGDVGPEGPTVTGTRREGMVRWDGESMTTAPAGRPPMARMRSSILPVRP